jgi:excisionase family DNA binding protein
MDQAGPRQTQPLHGAVAYASKVARLRMKTEAFQESGPRAMLSHVTPKAAVLSGVRRPLTRGLAEVKPARVITCSGCRYAFRARRQAWVWFWRGRSRPIGSQSLDIGPLQDQDHRRLWEKLDSTHWGALSCPAMAIYPLPRPPMEAEVLTLEEVAAYLRVSKKTAYRLARSGDLPAFKAANNWRVRRIDLDRWISRRTAAESLE